MAATAASGRRAGARRPSARPAWMEKPSIPTSVTKFIVLAIVVVVMLFPFLYVLSVSLTSQQGIAAGNLIPAHPTLQAYRTVFAGGVVTRALLVSIGLTVFGTIACMVMTTTLAFGLSRTSQVPGSKLVLYVVLGTLFFNAGIIPNYLLIRYLGLLNNYASLILPGLVVAFNLIVVRQFFMNIPEDLTDAAYVDGANPIQVFIHVALPLSKAVLAVVGLFYGVGIWSSYFTALLYLNNTAMWPIQLVLRDYVLEGQSLAASQQTGQLPPPAVSIQMAVVIIATVPILLVYPFLQRYFTQGVLSGAIKG